MVKRLVAMMCGALAGALLLAVVAWLRAPAEASADPDSIEHCIQDAYIDCVGRDVAPAPVTSDAPVTSVVAASCKDWLADGATAALSTCLHQARRERDAIRFENFKRAQRIAASS